MKTKLLQTFLKMSKYAFYCMILQSSLYSFALSHISEAQNKKLSEIDLKLNLIEVSLSESFEKIEGETDFIFAYLQEDLPDAKVTIKSGKKSMEDILLSLSTQSGVSFRRVNETIHVRKTNEGNDRLEEIIEAVQPIKITGKVLDENGLGLPGATVVEKGTTNGTITDVDGNYSINVSEGATLLISFVGYKSVEVAVNGRSSIDVPMEVDAEQLDEIVVVGYGEQRKETLTGSVVNVSGKTIAKSPVPNITNSLQGRLPGVIATNGTGEPGRDDAQILIRGRSTFGNTQPLLVVDGVIRPTEGLGRIDPQNIESITVLKDASAAIYGARAANGVILVKTKRGSTGKPEFGFSFNQGFSQPTRILDVLDAATYAEVRNEAEMRNGGTTPIYTADDIQKYRDGSSPLTHPNTDWVKETLKPWSLQNKMNLSVTGGSQEVQYFIALGLQNQEGHFKNNPTSYNQFNLRSNIDAQITENFKVSLNIAGRLEKRNYPSTGTWVNFVNILSAEPTLHAKYPNGLIAAGRFTENPLLRDQVGYIKQESNPIQSTLVLDYKLPFLEGLSVTGSYSYDFTNQFNKKFEKPYYYWQYDQATGEYERLLSNVISSPTVTDDFSRSFVTTYNLRFNYQRQFGDHGVGFMIGAERAENKGNSASAFRKNFPTTALPDINFGSSSLADQSTSGSSYITRRDNYFGRANYNYKEKYLAEFLFRYDGSPVFPENKRYGFFPGFSLGWRLSEEDFMKGIAAIDRLKIRGSYGQLGNDNIEESYAYLSSYSIGNAYTFGGVDALGLYPGVLPNPNYTWEVLKTTNLGLDASFWNYLLGIELDLFKQNRTNILAQRQLSISSTYGYPGLPPENIGEVENHGFELTLSHENHISEFGYRLRGNMSFARNKYVYFDEVPAGEDYQNQTGKPIGAYLIWPTDGIYHTQEEIDASVHLDNAKPGDVKYVDKNGDGFINGDDQYRTDLSNTPEIVFGLDMNFMYKNFDFTLFFQGQARAIYFPGVTSLGGASNSAVMRAKDRWTSENTSGSMPASGGNFAQLSEFNMYSASFVRLKNMEIGYTLPKSLADRVNLNDLRVYVNAFNVFTISEIDFMDPEGRADGSDPNSTRTDANYYPQLRVFNVGVNFSF
ncbi:TonB-dependent receptor [Marinoscillum sp. MHG1-6]|uniref:SusC/RagA family TonB-linked outer membrane protein n=1 Tax=Marinoscillum sp. MHG1-6 TaxID=2959627 RepID=UPI002158094F|nr:TonB-dependent receptor [Marinoscillum sp. MHG1-6]